MNKCTKFAFAIVITAISSQPSAVFADDCDVKGESISTATGAKFERRSKADVIFLTMPHVAEATVKCGVIKRGNIDIFLSNTSPYPSPVFFEQLGKAASSVFGASADTVIKIAKRCQKQALRRSDEMADLSDKKLEMFCHVFTRDGGMANFRVNIKGKAPMDE